MEGPPQAGFTSGASSNFTVGTSDQICRNFRHLSEVPLSMITACGGPLNTCGECYFCSNEFAMILNVSEITCGRSSTSGFHLWGGPFTVIIRNFICGIHERRFTFSFLEPARERRSTWRKRFVCWKSTWTFTIILVHELKVAIALFHYQVKIS